MNMQTDHPVIFYDGLCGLCDRSVQFIIKHDPQHKFRFAALDTAYAKQQLGDGHTLDSFVYFHQGKARYRSAAALYMFRSLGGWWRLLFVLMLVPPFIRNAVYNWVARNRYKWFGKYDQCPLPTPEQRALFISDPSV